jgi:hypothetical protein
MILYAMVDFTIHWHFFRSNRHLCFLWKLIIPTKQKLLCCVKRPSCHSGKQFHIRTYTHIFNLQSSACFVKWREEVLPVKEKQGVSSAFSISAIFGMMRQWSPKAKYSISNILDRVLLINMNLPYNLCLMYLVIFVFGRIRLWYRICAYFQQFFKLL